jgi:hypothetical protein
MAISRVPGFSLLSDLDRQGVDLQFTTDNNALVYMDFTNYRFGINTDAPQQTLEVVGNILVTGNNIYTSGNLNFDIGILTVVCPIVRTTTLGSITMESPF